MAIAKGGCPLFALDIFELGHRFSTISICCLSMQTLQNLLAQTSHIPAQDGNLLQPSAKGPITYGYCRCVSVTPPHNNFEFFSATVRLGQRQEQLEEH